MLGFFSKDTNYNEIVCLGYLVENTKRKLQHLKIYYQEHMYNKHNEIIKKIPKFDIVLIHWWNHPLLYDFLVRSKLPPCRVVMWGHNSGFHPPNIYTRKILNYPDIFVFTTPLTYDAKEVRSLSYEEKTKLRNIWSTGGIEEFLSIKPKRHKGFNVGYIGTVDYAKLHPNFLDMCRKINIPDVKFYVVGGLNHKQLEKQVKNMGIDNIVFTGVVKDVKEYLEIFDVFGYPLNCFHYGTCDLALQEAMAAGIVPVVLDNPMERYMVEHNGMVVRNEQEYVEAIEFLYKYPSLRRELSKRCVEHATEKFSKDFMVQEWEKIFSELLRVNKEEKYWKIDEEITYKNIFLESLGNYGKSFAYDEEIKKLSKINSWQTETKGSVHNYHSYFPEDPVLEKWSELMKKNG